MKKPILTIQDWDTGIADDPYKGFQLVKNLNENMEGIASCGFVSYKTSFDTQPTIYINADPDTDVITTYSDAGLTTPASWLTGNSVTYANLVAVYFTGADLPAGITAGTIYYTNYVSSSTLKLSPTRQAVGTSYVDITDAGSGNRTMSIALLGNVTQIAKDDRTGFWFAVDSAGKVWSTEISYDRFVLVDGNTQTAASGNGIAVWKDYVIVFRNNKIDTYGPLSSAIASRAWTNDWQTTATTTATLGSHNALNSINDKLYFCDGNKISSIMENSGQTFAPGTAGTFTYSTNALDLPDNYTAVELEDYGGYLAIAATSNRRSYIFPWDRVSSSFNFPVEIPETSIHSLVSINNILYAVTNSRAAVYATNLSSVNLVRRIPNHLNNTSYPANGVIDIISSAKMGGRLYLGIRAGDAITSAAGNTGVYSLDVQTGRLRTVTTLSNGLTSTTQYVGAIGQLGQFNDGTPYYFFFYYGTMGGVDMVIAQHPYTNYESQIISPIYQASTDTFESTPITKAIFYFQIPIGGSDAVKLEYREYDTQTWIELGEVTASTKKADQSPMIEMNFHAYVTQVQFRVSIKSNNTTGSTFVRLKKVDIF